MDIILCGTVVQKDEETEKFCTNEALYTIPMTDDEDETKVVDAVCLCQLHSDRFDAGHSLVVKTRKGKHLLIQVDLNVEPEQDTITNEA